MKLRRQCEAVELLTFIVKLLFMLFTQKTHYILWIFGLLCLVYGIYNPEDVIVYQFYESNVVVSLLHLVGAVAILLFLLGFGYYLVIKAKGSVPLFPTLIQLVFTFLLCYVVLFRIDPKQFEELTNIDIREYIAQPQDIVILFVLAMVFYSITLTWALLRRRELD